MLSILFLVERSPPLYHAYTAMTVFLWTKILSQYQFIVALLRSLWKEKVVYIIKLLAYCAVSIIVLEFLVLLVLHYIVCLWYSPETSFDLKCCLFFVGKQLHRKEAVHLVLPTCGYCCSLLSSFCDSLEILDTRVCVSVMLVFIKFHVDACGNPGQYILSVSFNLIYPWLFVLLRSLIFVGILLILWFIMLLSNTYTQRQCQQTSKTHKVVWLFKGHLLDRIDKKNSSCALGGYASISSSFYSYLEHNFHERSLALYSLSNA